MDGRTVFGFPPPKSSPPIGPKSDGQKNFFFLGGGGSSSLSANQCMMMKNRSVKDVDSNTGRDSESAILTLHVLASVTSTVSVVASARPSCSRWLLCHVPKYRVGLMNRDLFRHRVSIYLMNSVGWQETRDLGRSPAPGDPGWKSSSLLHQIRPSNL